MGASKFIRCPESGMRIQLFQHEKLIGYPQHSHSEMAIVICTAGTVESVQFSCRELLQENQVLFTNAGVPHASRYCVDGRPTHGVTIEFQPSLFERLGYAQTSITPGSIFLGKQDIPIIGQLARQIEDEAAKPEQSAVLMVTALARQIISVVIRQWPATLVRSHEAGGLGHLPRHELVRSIEIMNMTRLRDFSVPTLAYQLNRSPSAFSRLFTRSMGASPYNFFNDLVLRQAADLLSTTDRSVKDIALGLGFVTSSHFSSSFRQRWNVTPTEFRREMMAPSQSAARLHLL